MKRSLFGFVIVAMGLVISACGSDHAYLGSKDIAGSCFEFRADGDIDESKIPQVKQQLGLSDANCSRDGVVGTCKIVSQQSGGSIELLQFVTGDVSAARAACSGEFTAF